MSEQNNQADDISAIAKAAWDEAWKLAFGDGLSAGHPLGHSSLDCDKEWADSEVVARIAKLAAQPAATAPAERQGMALGMEKAAAIADEACAKSRNHLFRSAAKIIAGNIRESSPDRIFLVVGEDCPEESDFNDLQDVCWCADRQFDTDIEYVRASSSRAEVEIPEGYALVPRVPTPEMMRAMQSHEWPGIAYGAMLAAAEAPNEGEKA